MQIIISCYSVISWWSQKCRSKGLIRHHKARQLKSCSPILPTSKAFLVGLPLSMSLLVMKAGSHHCKLPLKAPETASACHFHITRKTKSGTGGLSWWTTCFHVSTLTPTRDAPINHYQPVFSGVVQWSHDRGSHSGLLY